MKPLKKLVAIELLLREAKEEGLNPYFLAYMQFMGYKKVKQVENHKFIAWNSDAWEETYKRAGKPATKYDHLETLVELIEQ